MGVETELLWRLPWGRRGATILAIAYFLLHIFIEALAGSGQFHAPLVGAMALLPAGLARQTRLWGMYWLSLASVIYGLLVRTDDWSVAILTGAAIFVALTTPSLVLNRKERASLGLFLVLIGGSLIWHSTAVSVAESASFSQRALFVLVVGGTTVVLRWRQLVTPALWALFPLAFAALAFNTRWFAAMVLVLVVGLLRSVAHITSRQTMNAAFALAVAGLLALTLRQSSAPMPRLIEALTAGFSAELEVLTGRAYTIDRWFLILVGLVLLFLYVWLADINGQRGPGPIDLRSFMLNGTTTGNGPYQALFRATLGGIRLADPAEIPGASNAPLTSLAIESTLNPSKLAQLLKDLSSRPSGFAVSIWVQKHPDESSRLTTDSGDIDLRTTGEGDESDREATAQIQIADARSNENLLSIEIARPTVDEVVRAAAFVVGRFAWERCATRPAWYTWRQRDGRSLASYTEAVRDRDLGYRDRAIRKLEDARALSPGNAVVRADLAVSYERASRFAEALHLYSQVSSDYQRFLHASYRMGVGCNFAAKTSRRTWNDYAEEPDPLPDDPTPKQLDDYDTQQRLLQGATKNRYRRPEIVELFEERGLLHARHLSLPVTQMLEGWEQVREPRKGEPLLRDPAGIQGLLLLAKPSGPERFLQKVLLHEMSRLVLEQQDSRLVRPRIASWMLYQSERATWHRLLYRPLELRKSRTVTRSSLLITRASLIKTIHDAAIHCHQVWQVDEINCARELRKAEASLKALLSTPRVGWQTYYNAACFYSIVFDFFQAASHTTNFLVTDIDGEQTRHSDVCVMLAFKNLNAALRQPDSGLSRTHSTWSTEPGSAPRNWWDIDPDLYPLRQHAYERFQTWKQDLPVGGESNLHQTQEANGRTAQPTTTAPDNQA